MPSSKDKIVKDGWGSRSTFQASYGLKMTPDGIEEGNRILEAMQEADRGMYQEHVCVREREIGGLMGYVAAARTEKGNKSGGNGQKR
jgi:hypothetical protein